MIVDTNKGIDQIIYNHLNLPTRIIFGNGNVISYLYNAMGQKVKKIVVDNSSMSLNPNIETNYLSGFQYKNNVLQFFPHAEGYVNVTEEMVLFGGTNYKFHYVFNFTDHLGNIRLSYSKDPATNVLKIIEENHYYPYGLKHGNYNSDWLVFTKNSENQISLRRPAPTIPVEPSYKYKYNGKEYQDELGLNMYDYGARNYDPALGRWMNFDPLAEQGRRWSPYNYAVNNPVFFIDPDGNWIEVNDGSNTYRYNNGKYYSQNSETKNWDVEANVSADSYAGKILSSLNKIANGDVDSFGSKYLNLFSNDNINVLIKENAESPDRNVTSIGGKEIKTSFTQDVRAYTTSNKVEKTDFYVTLFHELSHSYSDQVFNMNTLNGVWVNKSETNGLQQNIQNNEIYAVTVENVLRAEQGLPLRTHYSRDLNSSPIEDTRILNSKPKENPFTKAKEYQLTPTTRKILGQILNSKK